ncbi:hypothetical protein D3C85_1823460 [compost metagenome]
MIFCYVSRLNQRRSIEVDMDRSKKGVVNSERGMFLISALNASRGSLMVNT